MATELNAKAELNVVVQFQDRKKVTGWLRRFASKFVTNRSLTKNNHPSQWWRNRRRSEWPLGASPGGEGSAPPKPWSNGAGAAEVGAAAGGLQRGPWRKWAQFFPNDN